MCNIPEFGAKGKSENKRQNKGLNKGMLLLNKSLNISALIPVCFVLRALVHDKLPFVADFDQRLDHAIGGNATAAATGCDNLKFELNLVGAQIFSGKNLRAFELRGCSPHLRLEALWISAKLFFQISLIFRANG